MANRATSFTVHVDRAPRTASARRPTTPRGPFKFLRKDEGQRANGATPTQNNEEEGQLARRTSSVGARDRDFRQRVAADQQRGQHDPFAEAQVVVPKKAPPPRNTDAARAADNRRASPPNAADREALGKLDDEDEAAAEDSQVGHSAGPTNSLGQTRKPAGQAHSLVPSETTPAELAEDKQRHQERRPPASQHHPTANTHYHSYGGADASGEGEEFDDYDGIPYDESVDYPKGRLPSSTTAHTGGHGAPASRTASARPLDGTGNSEASSRTASQQPRVQRQYVPPSRHATEDEFFDDGFDDNGMRTAASARVAPVSSPRQQHQRNDRPRSFAGGVEYSQGPAEDGYDNFFVHQTANPTTSPRQRNGAGYGSKPVNARSPGAVMPPTSTSALAPAAVDEELSAELDRQLQEARAEKMRYQRLLGDAQRRRERDQKDHEDAMAELQADRDEFDRWSKEERREIRKERRLIDEARRKQTEAVSGEREANRRLQRELEAARDLSEKLSAEGRERTRSHRADMERLRRQVADLQSRNDELTEMVRSYQVAEADRAATGTGTTALTRPSSFAAGSASAGSPRGGRSAATRRSGALLPTTTTTSGGGRAAIGDETASETSDDRQQVVGTGRRAPATASGRSTEAGRLRDLDGINHSTDVDRGTTRGGAITSSTTRHLDPQSGRQQTATRAHQRSNMDGTDSADSAGSAALRAPTTQRRSSAGPAIPTLDEFLADIVEAPPLEDEPGDAVIARNPGADDKVEEMYRSGKRVIQYRNGTRKVVLPSGHVLLHFSNGDVKRTFPSGKTTYWYAVNQTTQTQMPDGLQLYQFHATDQTEKHYSDGRKEILYPEGVFKLIAPDGTETMYFQDGNVTQSPPPP